MRVYDMQVVEVDVDEVSQHPDNVNNGDVDAIEESIEVNGFYKPLLVQRSTGHILVGNHSYQAAYRAGARQVPVIYLDVDDLRARRIMLADNSINRRGFDDEGLLAAVLHQLETEDIGLYGTGYDESDLQKLDRDQESRLQFDDNGVQGPEPPPKEKADALPVSVIPVIDENGGVSELTVTLVGMGPITKMDFQTIRRALGLVPATKTEIDAYQVASWR